MRHDASHPADAGRPDDAGPGSARARRLRRVAEPDTGRPQQELALSLGPAEFGATVSVVPRLTTGRVNRAFEDVTADGQIHCYTSNEPWHLGSSWYVSVQDAESLRIERVQHAPDASPCAADPSTWSHGAGAVDLVR